MICALIIYHGKTFKDVVSVFEKATNTENTEIDYELAHAKKNSNYEDLVLMQLMQGRGYLP